MSDQKTKILKRITELKAEYAQKKSRYDEVFNGAQSASLSSGSGSKSYTNFSLDALRKELDRIVSQIARLKRRLAGLPAGGIRHIVTVRG